MIVLDASALVDVVLGRPAATWVLDEMVGEDACAPGHLSAEVLSALARFVRADELTVADARSALDDATALVIESVLPTAAHLRRALELGERIRVLDGLYVALAEERRCPLLTTDLRLARAELSCDVLAPT